MQLETYNKRTMNVILVTTTS